MLVRTINSLTKTKVRKNLLQKRVTYKVTKELI